MKALEGAGRIGLVYHAADFFVTKQRYDGFKATIASDYPNIKIVLSGHVGGAASRVDTGNNGNKILSLLQCFHSRTTNPVRLLKISVSKGTVASSVYAPYTKETMVGETTTSGFDFTQ